MPPPRVSINRRDHSGERSGTREPTQHVDHDMGGRRLREQRDLPPVPSFTITMLGTVSPPTKLRFDDNGCAAPWPHGEERGPGWLGDGDVQRNRSRPAGGPPGCPAIGTSVVTPPTMGEVNRVSSRRAGTIAL